jgi:hypothetical protein
MNRQSPTVVALSVTSVLAAVVAFFTFGRPPIPARAAPDAEPPSATRPAGDLASNGPVPTPTPPVESPPVVPVSLAQAGFELDEPALMRTLRELRGQSPERTLQLARDGNQRFKDSSDAAERAWFIVKSLSDLGRHDEARTEGRQLLQQHRETRWAEDVYRHLFVNPPTHPLERGYGKVLESDP